MENNLDKLFKSKLEGQDPEFNPAAWDRMEGLLDDVGMIPTNKKPNRARIIYLSLLLVGLLFSGIGYVTIKSSNTFGEGSTMTDNIIPDSTPETETAYSSTTKTTSNSASINSSKNKDQTQSQTQSLIQDQTQISDKLKVETGKFENLNGANDLMDNELKRAAISDEETEISSDSRVETINEPSSLASRILNSSNHSKNSIEGGRPKNTVESFRNTTSSDKTNLEENEEFEKASIANSKKEIFAAPINEREKTKDEAIVAEQFKTIELLPLMTSLETRTKKLEFADLHITPQIQIKKASLFEIGLVGSTRINGDFGYSIGPYINYSIGNGYSINIGGQFDSQDFKDGPSVTVYDKVYSFGSKTSERNFILSNQKSLRVPLGLRKSFNRFDISTGIIVKKIFVSDGSISESLDGEVVESASIDNEFLESTTLSFQLGASIGVTRFFDLDVGMEYRPKAFSSDSSISANAGKYYPTIGLRYKLFKF